MSTDSVKEARGERKKRAYNVERKISIKIFYQYPIRTSFILISRFLGTRA